MADIDALVNYFVGEKLFRHVQTACGEAAAKRGWDGKLLFWKCFSMAQEGNVNQAIREMETLRHKRDFEYAAIEALYHLHGSVKLQDHAAIAELDDSRKGAQERASDVGLLLAATFLMHVQEFGRARRMVDRILDKNPMNVKAATLRGWIELRSKEHAGQQTHQAHQQQQGQKQSSGLHYFEQALNSDRSGKKELDALMGRVTGLCAEGKLAEALETLDHVTITFSWFLPALVEKAKLLMLQGSWEMAVEIAERVLEEDRNSLAALRIIATYRLATGNDMGNACMAIQTLGDALEQQEPENPDLWVEAVKPLARLAERNTEVLRKTVRIVEKAKRKRPDSLEIATEHAYQLSLAGKLDAAFSAYMSASQLDESDSTALFGQIYCLVQRGDLEEASQQLEFLAVLQETIGRNVQMAFLESLLAWRRDSKQRASLKLLNETVQIHVRAFQAQRATSVYESIIRFNPDFMLEIAREYLQHAGTEPLDSTESIPQFLSNGIKLLEKTVKFVPCMITAELQLAQAKYVSNNLEAATKAAMHCLSLDSGFAPAHLVMAQIQLHSEDFHGAQSSLEQALSLDFNIRDSITYKLVKARCLHATGDLGEARSLLEATLMIPGIRTEATAGSASLDALCQDNNAASSSDARRGSTSSTRRRGSSRQRVGVSTQEICLHDRASVFVELAAVYIALKEESKAKTVIRGARKEFAGTSQDVRVIIADAEIALRRNDVKGALRMLSAVPVDSPAFTKAHLFKARIYLTHRNDKDAFVQCYVELVEQSPSAQGHVLLGEAYMRVNRPDEAIAAFKEALKRNPKDGALAQRIGKVLIATHDYARAVDYYKSALRSAESGTSRHSLRYDLSKLYFDLSKFSKAEKELQASLGDLENEAANDGSSESKGSSRRSSMVADTGLGNLLAQVKALKLLAKVHEAEGEQEKVVEALNHARSAQSRAVSSTRGVLGAEAVQRAKTELAAITMLLAQHFERVQKDEDQAIALYNEALRHDSSNVPAMLALAKLHLRSGDLERCHAQCVTTLRVDDQNEEASMMLADLMFQRNEVKVAIYHYQQLLERNPANFPALARLVSLLYRGGELETAKRYFQLAEFKSPQVVHAPGFAYCKGVFHRYGNEINEAISQFNKARRDVAWGERALSQMVEIYLNPDNANLWEDEGSIVDAADDINQQEAVRTAEKLLEEYPDKDSVNYRLLQSYATMSTKKRPDVERAFQQLVEVVQENPDHVPSLLALSTALMMMKQTPKARNQLKRISKMPYDQEQADAFERCWLLLADIFVGAGKYDLAQDLCKRCLQYNRSCAKAWDILGVIMEKEASYASAAEHYEQAWKYEGMASATVGYKLAFNYLKAKRYVEAIDISNQVLKQYPQYPKIKKEILDKARGLIRA
ncbi:Tetratricopeptide repeat protein 21B [Hondaea fermentalgiana]|uniref:Tetratricopeptide repeat protein 21B n=1 Tax=Hondaea fermentalgiana TaxID=2315210 RepID=A0A2R5GIU7_9STRA|nr:Tetratricopeptide repeat protein 21B [Hondaea fermentalgiana]|eukprot:GBG28211.1 Tetratricopeptide repeat protein 21B [Hondaea fermentalgiana]